MGMVYSWKPGTHVKIDAQAAGEAMERIRTRNNGRLEPEAVVRAARAANSPLHDHFEWDDRKAAHQFRKEQAGDLIRFIAVEIEKPTGGTATTRAFVSVVRDEDRSYTSVSHALSDDQLRQQVVAAAWAELVAWRTRHAELIELANIFAIVDQAQAA